MNNQEIHRLLKHYYGHDTFRRGQESIIEAIINGQDVLGIMPTGGGKSLCYQIPALVLEGVTIVVSPLISLMKDQVDSLNDMGIKAAYINSSLSQEELMHVVSEAKQGVYKLLYVAPERLETDLFINLIQNINISQLAIDEAHCVSQWGHDFRPSYTRINQMIERFGVRPIVTAFTATATPQVKEDIIQHLNLQTPYTLTTGFDRANLYYEVVKPKSKMNALKTYLNQFNNESGIIYAATRKNVEAIYDHLMQQGYAVSKYHGGLNEVERSQYQDDFIFDRKQIMVATNAFGMGIDKSNIRFIIHYNMPKNMESYYQEAGRAGRDGEDARCILLFGAQDVITNKFLIENSQGVNVANDYEKLQEMTNYCHTDTCLRKYILTYFGQNDTDDTCSFCGNCDQKIEKLDITIEAQKIISCVIRMKENYGANLVIDVLVGANTEKIRSLHLTELSTYGIMKGISKTYLKEIIAFLVAEGYLVSSGHQYPVLKCSPLSLSVLKGNEHVFIKRKIENKQEETKESYHNKYDVNLFEILRNLRKESAVQANVPPFIIFSDASLHDMSRKYPTTNEAFLNVNGVGKNKLEKYGKVFIDTIKTYVDEHQIQIKPLVTNEGNTEFKAKTPNTYTKKPTKLITYDLYQEGYSMDDIAKERNISKVTIENHLMECFKDGLAFELAIDASVEKQIISACHEVGTRLLKPIKEILPDEITYTEIKYVIIKNNL